MSEAFYKLIQKLSGTGEIYLDGERISSCRYNLQVRQRTKFLTDRLGKRVESLGQKKLSGVLVLGDKEAEPKTAPALSSGQPLDLQLSDGRMMQVTVQGEVLKNMFNVVNSSPDFEI